MNKKEHINNTILDFDTTLNILFDEYELDISLPIEKCLSNESIKDIIPTEENTIFDKLDSVYYKGIKINIIDTPGHADFGGEVERVLKMVDSVLLVVDSYEGPMPQTKFVLKKALELGLKPIVVINKIDKPDARPEEVIDEVFDLFLELGANDEQLDFPIIYASARAGYARYNVDDENNDMQPLFETIIKHVECPEGYIDEPFQMLVTTLDSNAFVGKIAIGKIHRGTVKKNQNVSLVSMDGTTKNYKVTNLYTYNGLKREEVNEASMGDIIALSGVTDANIGETIADSQCPEALPFVHIDEPTLSMNFMVNNSPFAGQDGEFITSRHLRDRLMQELETNVSLRVREITPECFEVSGRGELHLSVLIETMRREGFELLVSRPKVIFKEVDGVKCEPIEDLVVNVPDDCVGNVIEKLGRRKAEMVNMEPAEDGHTKIEFKIPARGLIGYRTEFLTDTKGSGTMNHIFDSYQPYKGDIQARVRGTIVAFEKGKSVTYGLFNAQDKGDLFIGPGVPVYQGMIVGVCGRAEDIDINVCKGKKLTNTRASGSDHTVVLKRPRPLTLEYCLDYINSDELVEITPENIRLRKFILNTEARKKFDAKK